EQRPRLRDSARSLRRQPQTSRTEISRPLLSPLARPRDQKRELDSSNQIIERWEVSFYRCQQLHDPASDGVARGCGCGSDGESGGVQPVPLPETTPGRLQEEED